MEQLVILVIIGLISLVNWLLQKSAEKREAAKARREAAEGGGAPRRMVRAQPPPSARRAPERDPMRELMEALGLPADAMPPPVPRTAPVPQPVFEEEEFSSAEDAAPPPLPASDRPSRRQPSWKQALASRQPDEKEARLASAFAAAESGPQKAGRVAARSLLATRASQRDAVVLAEILGPPRALLPAAQWAGSCAR